MTLLRAGRFGLLLLLVMVAGAGCFLESSGPQDEQKEPHYLTGKSRVAAYDYIGGVQAFERALQANPNSASAHLEMGLLLSDKEAVLDYAAAIYHLQRFLRLKPNANNADMIRERVMVCKQGLAREVPLGPITQQVQREIMKLTAENARLTNQVIVLRQHLDQMRLYLAQRAALAPTNPPVQPPLVLPPGLAASNATPTAPAPQQAARPGPARDSAAAAPPSLSGPAARVLSPPEPSPSATPTPAPPPEARRSPKTYSVKGGDTLGAIAKRNGVRLSDLLAANPGIVPTRLQVGQTITLPGP